jgi:hypothetical protein
MGPRRSVFALTMVALVSACDEPVPEPLPPVVQIFIQQHPELTLAARKAEPAPDWAQGKRWRVTLKDGQLLIFYEKADTIQTVKRRDLSTVWDRQDREKRK